MNGTEVVPPSDYSFFDRGSTITARSKEELYKALEAYRSTNGLDPGRVQEEVDQAIEERNGRMVGVTPPPSAFQVSTVDAPKGIRERVTQWAANRFPNTNQAIEYVLPDEAEARAAICADCPKNEDWKIGCPPCVENTDRVLLLLNKGQRTQSSPKLGACSIFGHDNKTAVVLKEGMLKHRSQHLDESPDFCWLRTL